MYIYARRTPESEGVEGAEIVMVSAVGEPDGPDTASDIVDHGAHDFPGSQAMVRLPDTMGNRAAVGRLGCTVGYWAYLKAEDHVNGTPLWEWRGGQDVFAGTGEDGDEVVTIGPPR